MANWYEPSDRPEFYDTELYAQQWRCERRPMDVLYEDNEDEGMWAMQELLMRQELEERND